MCNLDCLFYPCKLRWIKHNVLQHVITLLFKLFKFSSFILNDVDGDHVCRSRFIFLCVDVLLLGICMFLYIMNEMRPSNVELVYMKGYKSPKRL